MAVKVETTIIQVVDYDGKPTETKSVLATVKCDGPKCGTSDSVCKGIMSWKENKPEDIPDEAFRLLILQNFTGQKIVFFRPECLRDYMRTYVPPLSPREQAEIAARNTAVDASNGVSTDPVGDTIAEAVAAPTAPEQA